MAAVEKLREQPLLFHCVCSIQCSLSLVEYFSEFDWLLLFIAPISVLVGSATTSTITAAVKPPQVPGEIRRFEVAVGSKKCEVQAGPATPSCTLTGLAAGTQYNASAFSFGDDFKSSLPVFGLVNTLPDGRSLISLFEKGFLNMPNRSSFSP